MSGNNTQRVYDVLYERSETMTADEVSQSLNLHRSSIKAALLSLIRMGLVRVRYELTLGAKRPAEGRGKKQRGAPAGGE